MARISVVIGSRVLSIFARSGSTVGEVLRFFGYPATTYHARVDGRFVPPETRLPSTGTVEVLLVRGDMATARLGEIVSLEVESEGTRTTGEAAAEASSSPAQTEEALEIPKCDFCGQPAVTSARFSATPTSILTVHRCASCFLAEARRKVLAACRWHGLVKPGDHVLVPLSGGKDSAVELFFLTELGRETPHLRLTAYTLILGRAPYFVEGARRAAELTARLNVRHLVVELEDYYGTTLEAAVAAHPEATGRHAPCAVCTATRRVVERDIVSKLGVSKVTTGETLTDQRRHLLWGAFHETRWRQLLSWSNPDPVTATTRISPILGLLDHDTALVAHLTGLPIHRHQEIDCPFAGLTLRGRQTELVERVEDLYPGLLAQARERMAALLGRGSGPTPPAPARCPSCGDVLSSVSGRCPVCAIHEAYGLSRPVPRGERP